MLGGVYVGAGVGGEDELAHGGGKGGLWRSGREGWADVGMWTRRDEVEMAVTVAVGGPKGSSMAAVVVSRGSLVMEVVALLS